MKYIFIWLVILAGALGLFYYQQNRYFFSDNLIYPQAGQDRSSVESLSGLGYLNFLRAAAGLNSLSNSPVLERSARRHAKYLLINPEDSHDEKHRNNQFYTGYKPSDRARAMIERLDAYLSDCDALGIRADVEQPVRADVDIPVRFLSPELRDRAGARIRAAGLDAVPVTISGRIDRLEHLGGYEQQDEDHPDGNNGVRVMDLKTGQRVPKDVQRHPQLAAYRLALASQGHHVLGGALVLLGKEPSKRSGDGYVLAPPGAALDPSPATVEPAEQPAEDPGDEEANGATDSSEEYWAEDLVAGAAIAGSGPLLQARTGEHCRTCMVKDSCPVQVEGRRVVS